MQKLMAFLTATPGRRKSAHQQAQQLTKHEAEGKQQETPTPLVTATDKNPAPTPGSLPTAPRHLVTFRQ